MDRGHRHRFAFGQFALASAMGALLLLMPSVAMAQTAYPPAPAGPVATGGIAGVPAGGTAAAPTTTTPAPTTTTTSQPQVKGKQATRPGGSSSGLSAGWIAIIVALILALLAGFFFLFGRGRGEDEQPA